MSNVLANVNAQGESLRSEVGSVADCLITIRSFVPGPHERNAFEARVIDGNDKTRVFKRTSTPTARAKRLLVAKAIKLAAEKGYESYDLVDFDLVATEHREFSASVRDAVRGALLS